jgi:serine/threonine-protein kinase
MVGYPLLIAGSGLWFRVRFVWFMTALALVSYGVLLVDFYVRRFAALRSEMNVTYDRHVVFILAMIVLAGAVSYLVQRVRALSSFYGEKL